MKKQRRRGSALLLAIFFMTTIGLLAVAYIRLIPSELFAARRTNFDIQGYYAADAGLVQALAWLEEAINQGHEPLNSAQAGSYPTSGSIPGTEWTYTISITGDAQTYPNSDPTVTPRFYKIVTTSVLLGRVQRTLTSWVAQDTFAKYNFYNEQADTGGWLVAGLNYFTGPLHLNKGKMRLSIPSNFWTGSSPVMFQGDVTAVDAQTYTVNGSNQLIDGVEYIDNNRPYDITTGVNNATRYNKLSTGGRDGFKIPSKEVKMPGSSSNLADAAWFGRSDPAGNGLADPDVPAMAAGVYINKDASNNALGGIYISGDVERMRLNHNDTNTASGNGKTNPTIAVTQSGATTTVCQCTENSYRIVGPTTVDGTALAAGVEKIVPVGSSVIEKKNSSGVVTGYETRVGTTNGVIYATGSINKLSGTNKSKHTIAVDIRDPLLAAGAGNKEIRIDGDLLRADTPTTGTNNNPPIPVGVKDGLGLVAYNVRYAGMADMPRVDGTGTPDPLLLYALIFAGRKGSTGGVVMEDWNTGAPSTCYVMGSFIEAEDKAWGYFNAATGLMTTGWNMRFKYDPDLARNPTPFFPTIGKFVIRTYREKLAQAS